MDRDGYPDLAIAGDFTTSQVFWNNRDGTFTDGTLAARIPTGASVVIRIHHDEPGERYAQQIAASLHGRCRIFRSSARLSSTGRSRNGLSTPGSWKLPRPSRISSMLCSSM